MLMLLMIKRQNFKSGNTLLFLCLCVTRNPLSNPSNNGFPWYLFLVEFTACKFILEFGRKFCKTTKGLTGKLSTSKMNA
jgi:hypothetical protein